ncbi:MAG: acetylglutamate kinase [Acidobacteria bacterium]|nr:acetylglutamate kinase [Acidobacteriota bacterium]
MSGIFVVKLGGRILEEEKPREAALDAIAARFRAGDRFVVVHGGGRQVDAALERAGIPKRTHEGLRITDAATLDVVVSVLAGLVNKRLVSDLIARGIDATGIAGCDGGTLVAEPHPRVHGVDLGRVGRVVACRPALLLAILGAGSLPVVASIAATAGGELLNVNADAAASALAPAIGARRLLFLTDVEGVFDADGKVVRRIDADGLGRLLASDAVRGGMRPKLTASLEAIARGVSEVVIAGPRRHAAALATGKGGTRVGAA